MRFERILLFGGTGMVGRSIKKRFSIEKINILSPTRNEVNLFDKNQIENYLYLKKPDLIINAAGRVGGILFNVNNNYDSLIENSQIGINLISTAYKCGVENFLNISSSCVYPNNYEIPIKETELLCGPLETTNDGYALSKVLAIKACDFIDSKNSNMNYKTIIPCNLYGPGDKFEVDNSHLIPGVISKMHLALVNSFPNVKMWGDGSARREFLYVDDLSDFILFILNKKFKSLQTKINVGFGRDFTVNQYYELISKIVGYKGEIIKDLTKPTGMKRKLMDGFIVDKMKWKPTHSMEEGIRKTYKHYLSKL